MANTLQVSLGGGGRIVNVDELGAVKLPERTKSYCPIGHDVLLGRVRGALERSGLAIAQEQHVLSQDGDRYFGILGLRPADDVAKDYTTIVGIRNSHDKSIPAVLSAGAQVMVCSNLSVSGEVRLERKHTSNIGRNLPQLVESAIGLLNDVREQQTRRFETYKRFEISDGQAHDLVIQALDARVVPVTRIPAVLEEWRSPRHAEFRQGRTAWRLFNAFTETLKESSLFAMPRATQALHGLLDTTCSLLGAPSLN